MLVQSPQLEHLQHAVVVDEKLARHALVAVGHRRVPLRRREGAAVLRRRRLGDGLVLLGVSKVLRAKGFVISTRFASTGFFNTYSTIDFLTAW